MSTAWQTFDARLADWVSGDPSRIPLVTGGCQSGRSEMLTRVRARIGPSLCQTIDLARITSTPERFFRAILDGAPFASGTDSGAADGPASAYARALDYLDRAVADGSPATFLIDEILDIRVFESFPGLKTVVRDTFARLVASPNRFVLTARFTSRALRVARDLSDRLLVQGVPALEPEDVAAEWQRRSGSSSAAVEEFARAIVSLTGGRYGYVRELTGQLALESSSTADAARDPRHPRGGGTAHVDRDRARDAAHTRLDERLPVVARRRGSHRDAPQAVRVHRPAAAPLGSAERPARGAIRSAAHRGGPALRVGASVVGTG